MEIIKPKKLQKGDTIGILAISGRIKDFKKIENAKKYFNKCGYKVKISSSCSSNHRYMAGCSDEECINTFHDFFSDPNINTILCARGGYGTIRLINEINWDLIKANPKIFAGYSDITTLLNMIYKKTGLITFHSPMANGDFGGVINKYTKENFFKTLEGNLTEIKAENPVINNPCTIRGRLWGGNLATLTSLCGLDFVPNEDLILFVEDLNEPVYKIDKMFTQLFNLNSIKNNVKGIAIGEFQNIDNPSLLSELFGEISNKYKIPVCSGFKITHGEIKDTIPVGVQSLFEAEKGLITIQEEYLE